MTGPGPILHIQPKGGLANKMIQYLVALSVQSRVPGCIISNVTLPEWGIAVPPAAELGVCHEHRDPQAGYVGSLAALLTEGRIDTVAFAGYGQRFENLLPVARYRDVFATTEQNHLVTGERDLVINIRGGEVLDGRHPHYVLVPIAFYAYLIETTGLNPIFMGQIETNPYCDALRARFPHARFEASRGAIADFQTLRLATNIVPSISTFSWLACWLSSAHRVFLPVIGLFNPMQARLHNFCPDDDPRYEYYWFPATYSFPIADFAKNHSVLNHTWRRIGFAELDRLRSRGPLRPRRKDDHVRCFDERFYVGAHTDVQNYLKRGTPSGLLHYVRSGFGEKRDPCRIDRAWYVRTYPQAAWEVGMGDYEDLHHHYVTVGQARGYRPTGFDDLRR